MLTRDALDPFEKWSARSKLHLDAHAWKIDLADSFGAYTANVEAFHAWFRDRLAEHHRAEFAVVDALNAALRAAQKAAGFDDE